MHTLRNLPTLSALLLHRPDFGLELSRLLALQCASETVPEPIEDTVLEIARRIDDEPFCFLHEDADSMAWVIETARLLSAGLHWEFTAPIKRNDYSWRLEMPKAWQDFLDGKIPPEAFLADEGRATIAGRYMSPNGDLLPTTPQEAVAAA